MSFCSARVFSSALCASAFTPASISSSGTPACLAAVTKFVISSSVPLCRMLVAYSFACSGIYLPCSSTKVRCAHSFIIWRASFCAGSPGCSCAVGSCALAVGSSAPCSAVGAMMRGLSFSAVGFCVIGVTSGVPPPDVVLVIPVAGAVGAPCCCAACPATFPPVGTSPVGIGPMLAAFVAVVYGSISAFIADRNPRAASISFCAPTMYRSSSLVFMPSTASITLCAPRALSSVLTPGLSSMLFAYSYRRFSSSSSCCIAALFCPDVAAMLTKRDSAPKTKPFSSACPIAVQSGV